MVKIETRRAEIRQERQEIDAELAKAEDDLRRKAMRNGEDLEAAVEKLLSGEFTTKSEGAVPEQVEILRSRSVLLRLHRE